MNLRVLCDGPAMGWRTSQRICETEEAGREFGAATAWWPLRI